MTTPKIDTTREAVDRFIDDLWEQATAGTARRAEKLLRALLAERDLADARAAAAAQAMREAAAMTGHAQADGNTRHAVLRSIRDLPLPADTQAALDRLIAAEREACAKVADENTFGGPVVAAAIRARGSKEGQS